MATQRKLFGAKKPARKAGETVKIDGYHVKGKTIQRKPYDVKGHTRKAPKGRK